MEVDDLPFEEVDAKVLSISNEKVLFKNLLPKLSQTELVDFLAQHATAEQRRLLLAKKQTTASSRDGFYLLKDQFEVLLQQRDLESSMLKMYLALMKAHWTDFAMEIAQLLHASILMMQEEMEEKGAFSLNAVYAYYQLELDQYTTEFLMDIPTPDFQKILPAFWFMAVNSDLEYNLLEKLPQLLLDNWPEERSSEELKQVFFTDDLLADTPAPERLEVFQFLRPVLEESEVLLFLEKGSLHDTHYACLYAEALLSYGHVKRAIEELEAQVQSYSSDVFSQKKEHKLYELRIEVAQKYQSDELAQIWCKHYIQNVVDRRSLDFVIQQFPAYQAWFETLIAERNAAVLLFYLEQNDRVVEAEALFEKYPEQVTLQAVTAGFYPRHKSVFPKKALHFLEIQLKEILEYTGDDAYQDTARILLDIGSIEPEAAFKIRLEKIKVQFKRRRNLMKILKGVGL
jgi:hypothetical protein